MLKVFFSWNRSSILGTHIFFVSRPNWMFQTDLGGPGDEAQVLFGHQRLNKPKPGPKTWAFDDRPFYPTVYLTKWSHAKNMSGPILSHCMEGLSFWKRVACSDQSIQCKEDYPLHISTGYKLQPSKVQHSSYSPCI